MVGKDAFDRFIPYYFTKWQRKSLSSDDFKETLLEFFASDKESASALSAVDWDSWFYKPGLPPKPDFDTSMVDECYALAEKWADKVGSSPSPISSTHMLLRCNQNFKPAAEDVRGWTGNQIVVFLEKIQLLSEPLTPSDSQAMGAAYNLFETNNVEVSSRYYRIGLRAKDTRVYEPAAELLGRVGRMKFVRPLYRSLVDVDRDLAVKTFEQNRDFYHPICRAQVAKDLGLGQDGEK